MAFCTLINFLKLDEYNECNKKEGGNMYDEIPNIIKLRSSVRRYKPTPVSMDKILTVLDAARLAPSWENDQPVRYVVVNDPEILQEISAVETVTSVNSWIKSAPCVIVGISDSHKSGVKEGLPYHLVDFGASMENLMLAAVSLGLGTCWIGLFNEERVKSILSIPKDLRVISLTPLGYPDYHKTLDADESYSKKVSRRVELNAFAFFNKWENPV